MVTSVFWPILLDSIKMPGEALEANIFIYHIISGCYPIFHWGNCLQNGQITPIFVQENYNFWQSQVGHEKGGI